MYRYAAVGLFSRTNLNGDSAKAKEAIMKQEEGISISLSFVRAKAYSSTARGPSLNFTFSKLKQPENAWSCITLQDDGISTDWRLAQLANRPLGIDVISSLNTILPTPSE